MSESLDAPARFSCATMRLAVVHIKGEKKSCKLCFMKMEIDDQKSQSGWNSIILSFLACTKSIKSSSAAPSHNFFSSSSLLHPLHFATENDDGGWNKNRKCLDIRQRSSVKSLNSPDLFPLYAVAVMMERNFKFYFSIIFHCSLSAPSFGFSFMLRLRLEAACEVFLSCFFSFTILAVIVAASLSLARLSHNLLSLSSAHSNIQQYRLQVGSWISFDFVCFPLNTCVMTSSCRCQRALLFCCLFCLVRRESARCVCRLEACLGDWKMNVCYIISVIGTNRLDGRAGERRKKREKQKKNAKRISLITFFRLLKIETWSRLNHISRKKKKRYIKASWRDPLNIEEWIHGLMESTFELIHLCSTFISFSTNSLVLVYFLPLHVILILFFFRPTRRMVHCSADCYYPSPKHNRNKTDRAARVCTRTWTKTKKIFSLLSFPSLPIFIPFFPHRIPIRLLLSKGFCMN